MFNKYVRKELSRLINLEKNHSSIMYGYKIYPYLNVAPLFVTYEKKLDKASSINYEDYFNNPVSIEEITAEDYIFINGD